MHTCPVLQLVLALLVFYISLGLHMEETVAAALIIDRSCVICLEPAMDKGAGGPSEPWWWKQPGDAAAVAATCGLSSGG